MMKGFSGQRFLGYFRKEMKQIRRDPSTMLIAFFLPLLMIFLFGYGVSLDVEKMRIGIVLEDTSPEARGIVDAFLGSHYFSPQIGYNRPLFEKKLIQGNIRGILTIPDNFSKKILKKQAAPFQLIVDGSEPNMAMYIRNYVTTVVDTWGRQNFPQQRTSREVAVTLDPHPSPFVAMSEIQASSPETPEITEVFSFPPITQEVRVWFNPSLRSKDVLLPGSIAIIMSFIGTLLTALVVAREWERGTMEAILATPLRMSEMFLAKLIPYFLLGLGSMTLCVLTSLVVFDVPFRGSFLILLLSTSFFLIASLGQGLLISSATRNQLVSCQIAIMLGFLPAFSLSGFIFEIDSMPWIIQAFTYLFPPRYFVTLLQSIFLSGTVWELVAFNLGMMGCIALFFFALTLRQTSKGLE